MDKSLIKEKVNAQVANWAEVCARQNVRVELTPGAIEMITLAILNIVEDQSPYWRPRYPGEGIQLEAIRYLPRFLDKAIRHQKFWGAGVRGELSRGFENRIRVSSWEILHGVTPAIEGLRFVPKDWEYE